ncbi:DUF4450 domain-containing protein [Hymenobacter norwichensis]|uniref:DUF4450 domain-containing protein n=1 Tax=Hymenobacter norwichensis TaxID=223903 RepID=UPI0003B5AD86|nr:DUF4450 domain-containing protein [Hymenobacter norwichensis]
MLATSPALAQPTPSTAPAQALWHNEARTLRYRPDGTDFVIENGTKRFTRALYGTNTAFRVETGDLPEFALYLPGMGGNFKFGLQAGNQSKWLIKASRIVARYRPGAMLYEVSDPLLGTGKLLLEVQAMADAEGMLIKAQFEGVPAGKVQLVWAYGGVSGKKFSRDGDIGADPESSFYLKPEYCTGNTFQLQRNTFQLTYGVPLKKKEGETKAQIEQRNLIGVVPPSAQLRVADATQQESPGQLLTSKEANAPVLAGSLPVKTGEALYFAVQVPKTAAMLRYTDLPAAFARAEAARQQLASRIQVTTPDPYINTLGGALGVAADAIWQEPGYLHGAIAWRMPLNGWRGAYTADPLGWHDRAQTHFRAYAKSQLTSPAAGPVVMDTALNLARSQEKLGTSVYSSGYISRNPGGDFRPHHYDMNLVFIDELLRHFNWTGDLAFAKEMYPVLQRHLAWEKRNFDSDNDHLYDAYAAIWASDALQYSGGAVTHSSAYNYLANQLTAELAERLGENPAPYRQEATAIKQAIDKRLWLSDKGWYAEYQDALGLKQLHPAAGLWTVYHALDSRVPDPFQAYQALRYVDAEIPHIPVRAAGLPDEGYYLLSTTNWQPYDWSINNVAMAEVLHTTLANWQAGRSEEAFKLWKSALLESMYLGSSPGNFQQVSFYDAHRGELYRDFADPIGMASRSLVEGLFGIQPDALAGTLVVRPGLPAAWNDAALKVPDVTFNFRRTGQQETYTITPRFAKPLKLRLKMPARGTTVQSVTVNGQPVKWQNVAEAVGQPVIEISSEPAANYVVQISWAGDAPDTAALATAYAPGAELSVYFRHALLKGIHDPQRVLSNVMPVAYNGSWLKAKVSGSAGSRTAFVQLQQGDLMWWAPLALNVQIAPTPPVAANRVPAAVKYEKVSLTPYFNDKVTQIFQNKYVSPRPVGPTLQLPTQGIGNWCYPLTQAVIDDAGLRQVAGAKNEIQLPGGIPLGTPGAADAKNILFVSQWDNYADSQTLPLRGKARHAYLLMAGSTNPMQSQMTNGEVVITYADNSTDILPLRNPTTWWPIEQDYLEDGFAFTTGVPRPYRLYLKTGQLSREAPTSYTSIKGFSTRAIDGGAATVLDLPLNPKKKLKSLTLRALSNDVVIGLMSVTLARD